jgi:hypothetical protein
VAVELQHDVVELLGASATTVVVSAAESNGRRARPGVARQRMTSARAARQGEARGGGGGWSTQAARARLKRGRDEGVWGGRDTDAEAWRRRTLVEY